ncbi:hypothetical protein GWK47_015006 [Chionoecetes opilio]|uniref:CCHC-type domain-containing protein n=1 Tax=Chionoecetes opilio TaxID=41210 RepID=A0A8J4XSR2_CHIOP|nr:hypothetical protein GWK47_015006 [Chionoecetes opilio]
MEHFVDALQNRELQLYIKQAHPKDVREALARALELEAFMCTSVGGVSTMAPARPFPTHEFRARRVQAPSPPRRKPPTYGRSSPGGTRGPCWGCGQKGHWLYQCTRVQRSRSLERPAPNAFQPCCKNCEEYGHFSNACPWPKDVEQAGNEGPLAGGAASQPVSRGPLAI